VRPVRLELVGFLSYSEPTVIELEGLDAAVIVGENGAGKTSIVEAIGWALFGKGRARSPDDYVSIGAASCTVTFEFLLGDDHYRVLRERSLTSGGKSYLGLFAYSHHDQEADLDGRPIGGPYEVWQPVGGDRIEETQRKIEELLGLTYDTWLASSFIGQNRADQFTRMTAAGRKELLTEVLQLEIYARLHEEAQGRARTLAGEMVAAQRRLEDLEDVLAREGEARARVAAAVDAGDSAEAAVTRAQESLAATRNSLELARADAASVERARDGLEDLRRRRQERASHLTHLHAGFAEQRRQAEAEAERAKEALKELASASARATEFEGQAFVKEQEAQAARVESEEALAEGEAHRTAAAAALERVSAMSEEFYQLQEQLQTLQASTAPSCPICERELDPDDRAALVEKVGRRVRELEEGMAEKRRRAEDDEELARLAREKAQRAAMTVVRAGETAGSLRREADRATAAAERIPQEEARLHDLDRRAGLLATQEQGTQLELAQLQEPAEDEARLERAIQAGAVFAEQVESLGREVQLLEGTLQEARARSRDRAVECGKAEANLEYIQRARSEHDATKAELGRTSDLRYSYEILVAAFGRDGIPALIVENAVPEIEEEANRFLEKLTAGRYSVRLESLKATKSGSLKETLEILVADGSGERSLESLSGAERQCVDLSLRIGLSRLLARRAGRQIQTLVIDEGFTAFDVGHLQASIEALHTLQEEFPTLLVITHQQELANAFSTRIQVSREGEGPSRVEVAA
jgi:exonuclease SbcC